MKKAEQIFIWTTAICFAFTALGKLLSFWTPNAALVKHDPLFDVPFFILLLFAAIFELIVIAYCIFGKLADKKMLLIAAVSANFPLYRMSLYWMNYEIPCNCAGVIFEKISIPPILTDWIMKILLACMLAGVVFFRGRRLKPAFKAVLTKFEKSKQNS